ncbi:hypothetical protein [Streptomyces shaanxiensis]|uniref:Uncharacterized protein n=1 Tax=Streptomyces shaanxiensis TaxID=653357 RepID=A0ABP7VQW3_9ACTN
MVITAPLAAWAVGATVHDRFTATASEQARSGRHTTAVLLKGAPAATARLSGGQRNPEWQQTARRWTPSP